MLDSRKLRDLRCARRISARQVEEASQRIAIAKADKRFYISNSWLTQLENSASEPGLCKLFSLSVIYRTMFSDLLRFYGVDLAEVEKLHSVATPGETQVLRESFEANETKKQCAPNRSETTLNSECAETDGRRRIVCGYIGLNDFTMYPMIRPGSTVKIDTTQTRVMKSTGRSEHERPIYFLEIRDAFVCGWCEQQGRELLLLPHYCSPVSTRRFRIPNDAEVVGRVIAFETRCIDDDLLRLTSKAD